MNGCIRLPLVQANTPCTPIPVEKTSLTLHSSQSFLETKPLNSITTNNEVTKLLTAMMIQDQNNNLADRRVMKTRSLGVEKMIPKLFGLQTWVWNTSSVEKNRESV